MLIHYFLRNRKLANAGLGTAVVAATGKLGPQARTVDSGTSTGIGPGMATETAFPMHMPGQHYVSGSSQTRLAKQVLTNPVPAPSSSPKRKREAEEIQPEADDEECAEGQFNRMLETMSLTPGPHSRQADQRYKKIIMPWTGLKVVRSTFL